MLVARGPQPAVSGRGPQHAVSGQTAPRKSSVPACSGSRVIFVVRVVGTLALLLCSSDGAVTTTCAVCDMTSGRYLSGTSFVNVSADGYNLTTGCEAGYYCVEGCCNVCAAGLSCPAATVVTTAGFDANACPAGYLCDDTDSVSASISDDVPVICGQGSNCVTGVEILCAPIVEAEQLTLVTDVSYPQLIRDAEKYNDPKLENAHGGSSSGSEEANGTSSSEGPRGPRDSNASDASNASNASNASSAMNGGAPGPTRGGREPKYGAKEAEADATLQIYVGVLDGMHCASGSSAMTACPEGYYCLAPTDIEICPEGHYCPAKSRYPRECPTPFFGVGSCPSGTTARPNTRLVGYLVFPILLLVYLGTVTVNALRYRWARQAEILRKKQKLAFLVDTFHRSVTTGVAVLRFKNKFSFGNSLKSKAAVTSQDAQREELGGDGERVIPLASAEEEREAKVGPLPAVAAPVPGTKPGWTDEGISIDFENVCLHVKIGGHQVPVVNKVTGRIKAGTMTALMGASGAGKTSFLNALCGRAFYGTTTGTVKINGEVGSVKDRPDLVGFVPQSDDTVHGDLTVYENLLFSGRLRLPTSMQDSDIQALAVETMEVLELSHVRDSLVGRPGKRGISGGQRKRVNIAVELMAKPRLLFLDEPTSGLDAASATVALSALQQLARKTGVTIVTVIHQPRYSIYAMFHQVILLAQGGFSIFQGKPTEAIPYLERLGYVLPLNENAADFLLDVSTGSVGPEGDQTGDKDQRRKKLIDAWSAAASQDAAGGAHDTAGEEKPPLPPVRVSPGFFRQLRVLVRRIGLQRRRDLMTIAFNVALVVAASYISAATSGVMTETTPMSQSQEYGMISALLFGLLITLAYLPTFSSNKLVFYRDASSGMSVTAFWFVNVLFDLAQLFIMALWAAVVCYEVRYVLFEFSSVFALYVFSAWFSSAWAYMLTLLLPRGNLYVFAGLWSAVWGSLASGCLSFLAYKDIYNSQGLQIFIGLVSSVRWHAEWYLVSEYRALPPQYGYTGEALGFETVGLAMNDLAAATQPSPYGWQYNWTPMFLIGLGLRVLSLGLILALDRQRMNRKSVLQIVTAPCRR